MPITCIEIAVTLLQLPTNGLAHLAISKKSGWFWSIYV